MFGKSLRNPDKEPDKVSWDIALEELMLGQTCSVQEPDISS
jgi:hypothetical protein